MCCLRYRHMPSFLSKTGFAACLCGALAVAAQARASHTQVNRAQRAALQFHHAELLRRHLLAEPKSRRTPSQYAAALNAYRAVYHGDPASADAPKSVFAVAELLQIEGRQFHNTKDFRDARAQYEFLRQQYPASPLRRTALWAETEIARNDLPAQAQHKRIQSQRNVAQRNPEAAPRVARVLFPDMTTGVSRNRVSHNAPASPPTQDAVQDVETTFVSDTPSADAASTDTASTDTTSQETPAFDAAAPDGTGSTMARVLGLRVHRIVIDAGHGGHDSGTLGPYGLEEKNVVLDVALRLGKLLHERLGAQVIYTRRSDTFVPLQARTAIANRAKADLFLSIHANSSPDEDARGVETYFLNFTASPDALAVAARENAASDRSVYELSNIVRKIALSDKIDESRTLATDVQQSMYQNLEHGNFRFRNRGVKQAPFVVLIGAHMPSILAEISFLSNTSDAAELRRPAYRQRIAESIYNGVAAYVESMGGVRIAENTSAAE